MSPDTIATLVVTAIVGIPSWIDLILRWKDREK